MLRAGSQRSSTRYCTVSSDMRQNCSCRNGRPIKLLLHLGLLTLLNEARAAHIDQTLAERHGDRQCATRMSHPYTVDQVKLLNMFRQRMGDDQSNVGAE